MLRNGLLWLVATKAVLAQQLTSLTTPSITLTGTVTDDNILPTGAQVTYLSISTTRTLSTGSSTTGSNVNGSVSFTTKSGTTQSLTYLAGGSSTSSNSSATSTSSAARPTNTQPCNNYPEFCSRKYSNITEVCAHNSPFVKKNNVAANQALAVTDQLNDGVRMLQGQTHLVNNTLYFCHTSCDLLNVGTVKDYLSTIAAWVSKNPYDVVTILLGNGDLVNVDKFVGPIQDSGLAPYLYTPPKVPMGINDWPLLSEMILTQKRVVVFLDYNANQTTVPYILDEFTQMNETPFSPTNVSFPCNMERPPGLPRDQYANRLYIANHNLNTQVSIAGLSLLLPNVATLNITNGLNGTGSLGQMTNTCISDWGRPPNFLLVDYYNQGDPAGTVFEVAARANNVTYNRKCCGVGRSDSTRTKVGASIMLTFVTGLMLFIV